MQHYWQLLKPWEEWKSEEGCLTLNPSHLWCSVNNRITTKNISLFAPSWKMWNLQAAFANWGRRVLLAQCGWHRPVHQTCRWVAWKTLPQKAIPLHQITSRGPLHLVCIFLVNWAGFPVNDKCLIGHRLFHPVCPGIPHEQPKSFDST